ncbi:MAG: hypothetical protein F6K30_28145 [Cyanothece sp. SIO2G6]|nr:hypothetical protein [Cyanothece sp. SIO2G6]
MQIGAFRVETLQPNTQPLERATTPALHQDNFEFDSIDAALAELKAGRVIVIASN